MWLLEHSGKQLIPAQWEETRREKFKLAWRALIKTTYRRGLKANSVEMDTRNGHF